MSLGTTWYTLEKAVDLFSLDTEQVLKWAEEGSIRAEQADTRSMRVKSDDLERMVQFAKKNRHAFRDCD